ncbi:MAG: serine/threonine-protein kinase [Myxococcota bacterium]
MAEDDPPRALVAGKYRLSRLLGRGGMGSVWEGVHTTLGTRVAVKFIEAEYANSTEARNRFENEARAAAKLQSKYVVEVYDHGVGDDGRPFIVMEYLQGEPLDRRLDRVGRLPAKETAFILQQVCRALAKAHAAGIVHRDLKPENIFLVWDDEDGADVAKVVDFGIAKFTDRSLGPSSATRTGSVLGTPYYMSPEQARGLRSVDYRTDIWSLGVIAYRCIVGTLPFDGEAIGDLLVKLCTAPIPLPSQVVSDAPPGFDAFITRALAREPSERFQTVQEFAASLSAVCGISVRGAYGTGEQPQYLNAMGTGPHPTVAGPLPTQVATASELAAATGAPLTQTSPSTQNRSSKSALVASGIAATVVLAIGIGVAIKALGGSSDSAATANASAVPLASLVPPTPSAVSEPPITVVAPKPSSSAPPPKPVAAAVTPQPARPVAAAPRPAAPPPRRPEPVVARPQPAQPTPAKKEIDIGY